jgi:hypothetical protein
VTSVSLNVWGTMGARPSISLSRLGFSVLDLDSLMFAVDSSPVYTQSHDFWATPLVSFRFMYRALSQVDFM